MKRYLIAGLVAGITVLYSPLAVAGDDGYHAEGGCRLTSLTESSVTGEASEGFVDAEVVVYADDLNPVTATVTCTVLVNGTEVGAVVGSGTAVVVVAGHVVYVASETDSVQICTRITFPNGRTEEFCGTPNTADAGLVCEILRLLGPSSYPPNIYVDWDGDVWVGSFRVIDCPPTGNRP